MKKSFFLFFSSLLISAIAFSASPVLSASATQPVYPGTSKPYLSIVSGSGKISYVSSALNDPTDPAVVYGIYFTITNSPTLITFTSDKPSVLPNANISFVESGGVYILKVAPIAVGYALVTIIASNADGSSSSYKVKYAVSAASAYPYNTIWSANMADASGATAIDDNYMFACDDETNILRLYSRKNSGIDLYNINIQSAVGASEECDLEGSSLSVKNNVGKRIYWIGSLGNSKSGNLKPNRDRVFATDISGTGANSTLSVKCYSTKFRAALITWGNDQLWNFTASAAEGKIPKLLDGFNVEGLTVTHGGDTGYVGFRAPCVPIKGTAPTASNRKYAIIAPVTNFETIMNGTGNVSTVPLMAEPILFDLGGLGIRSIERVGTNLYLIVAGLFTGGGTPAIYLWDGKTHATPGTNPITITSTFSKLTKLNLPGLDQLAQVSANGDADGHPEALVAEQVGEILYIHLICDNGTVNYYADVDGTEAKALSNLPYRKFRYDNFVYDMTNYTTNCTNGNIKFYTTALDLPGFAYQWQVDTGSGYTNISDNSIYSGTTTRTLTLTNAPTSMTGYSYKCLAIAGDTFSGGEYTLRFKAYWTGSISNAWEVPGNWGCGILPDENTDVIINAGTPVLSSNATIRSISANPYTSVKINAPNKLTILH